MTYVPMPGAAVPIANSHIPSDDLFDAYIDAVRKVMLTGAYRDRYGWSERVARSTSDFLGLPDDWEVFPLRSGTDALAACLALAGVGPGDTVVAPDLAYHAVGSVILQLGAYPALLDVDEEDWNLSPVQLERFLAKNQVAAVVGVDNYGSPCAWPEISDLCHTHRAPFVLDSCESLGAHHPDGLAWEFADFIALSYNFTKPLHSAGMGGAICVPVRVLAPLRDSPRLLLHQRRLPELNAAYLALSWPELGGIVDHLRAIYDRYRRRLKEFGLRPQPDRERGSRSHAPFLLPNSYNRASRDDLLLRMADADVEVRSYFQAQSVVFGLGATAPMAKEVADRVVCLPTGAGMSLETADLVVDVLVEHLRTA